MSGAGVPAGGAEVGAQANSVARPSFLLEVRGVTVRYGRLQALTDVELGVEAGELRALVGPDGAGKSTLLRVMAGLQRPTTGRVQRFPGVDRGSGRDAAALLGYAGADFDLYSDLTVRENVDFFARLRGMAPGALAAARDRLLELTGLSEARNRLAGRLSGGMKKKLSLATALVHEPPLLLLDEPTVGVDPASRRELWDIVAQANAWGTAVVYSTPYVDEASRARRLTLLSRGRAVESSPAGLLGQAAGWGIWVVSLGGERREVRGQLARAGVGPTVYLRPEGLAVVARDGDEARRLATAVVGGAPALVPGTLTAEDAFVVLDWARAGAGGADGEPTAGDGREGRRR